MTCATIGPRAARLSCVVRPTPRPVTDVRLPRRHCRFNPNLYNNGKCCLSLLGTWQGPGWDAGSSTLLQVLVSIQSMILGTSAPYFNEPGYANIEGTAAGDAASRAYNEELRHHTLLHAILPALRNPPAGLEEVVRWVQGLRGLPSCGTRLPTASAQTCSFG